MKYFDQEFLHFFQELGQNNHREWFNDNKKRYTQFVKEPFEAFVESMLDLSQELFPGMENIRPKDCIFRIYRDVRFSKDKSPYKTHMSAVISSGGRKDMTSPGMYVQLSAEDSRLYSGLYKLDKHQLLHIREAISQQMDTFASLISDAHFKETFGQIQGEKNKRLQEPFKELSERQPLLFNKSFYYFKTFPADSILKEDFAQQLIQTYEACRPISEFFHEAIQA
ncbi:MAG: DUF2461 domain-containing protein [Bacteroidota bacterium]